MNTKDVRAFRFEPLRVIATSSARAMEFMGKTTAPLDEGPADPARYGEGARIFAWTPRRPSRPRCNKCGRWLYVVHSMREEGEADMVACRSCDGDF